MWSRFSDRFPELAVLAAVLTILATFAAAGVLTEVLGLPGLLVAVLLVAAWVGIFAAIQD